MKFQCLGYFDQQKMDALPKEQLDAIMLECQPHLDELYKSGKVLMDVGVAQEVKSLQRVDGKVQVDGSSQNDVRKMLGSMFIIEAQDMDDAIQVASKHPTVQVSGGEQLGWELEIRPIEHYEVGQ